MSVGKAGNLLAVDWREAIDEHTRDQTDVPATLSQRGDRDRVGCQAIIEVGAETPFSDRIFQTRVRRRYDTNVDLDSARIAQTLPQIGKTSCRQRACRDLLISVAAVTLQKTQQQI